MVTDEGTAITEVFDEFPLVLLLQLCPLIQSKATGPDSYIDPYAYLECYDCSFILSGAVEACEWCRFFSTHKPVAFYKIF